MTERQKLIAHKRTVLCAKARLREMAGIEVIQIFDQKEPEGLNEIYSAYTSTYSYDYALEPYSRMPCQSPESRTVSWIIAVMELKEGAEYFFRCCGLWVRIRIQNLQLAVQSLWYEHNFVLAEINLHRILEAGFDSRDEDNYLIDIWECTQYTSKT